MASGLVRVVSDGGGRGGRYPVSAVGPRLSSLRLRLLQSSVGEGVFVEAVGAKGTGSTALVKVPTRFSSVDTDLNISHV